MYNFTVCHSSGANSSPCVEMAEGVRASHRSDASSGLRKKAPAEPSEIRTAGQVSKKQSLAPPQRTGPRGKSGVLRNVDMTRLFPHLCADGPGLRPFGCPIRVTPWRD